MKYTSLISAPALAESLFIPDWLVLDCRAQYLGGKKSYDAFLESHIPNAYYCSFSESYLPNSDNKQANPYHTVSSPQIMLNALAQEGFDKTSQIVIYDNDCNSFTNNMWLQLRSLGCRNVAVLQGGFDAWKEMGFSLTTNKISAKNSSVVTKSAFLN